jgi:hypothetical protein
VSDFDLMDVWRIPLEGEAHETLEDYERIATAVHERLMTRGPASWLFRLRFWLGRVFKWDETSVPLAIPGATETTLRARLPDALKATVDDPDGGVPATDFTEVYRLPDELVLEISNRTVHAAMHTGRVPLDDGHWGVEMAVYTKMRGWKGRLYMKLIGPFRHLIVYPALMRQLKKAWENRRVHAPGALACG